jgi:hypothetical protein
MVVVQRCAQRPGRKRMVNDREPPPGFRTVDPPVYAEITEVEAFPAIGQNDTVRGLPIPINQ